MAKIMNKNDLMVLYKLRYGVKCLEASMYYGYTKKKYEEAIDDWDRMESIHNIEEEEEIYRRRLRCENIEIEKNLKNNFI